jgi:glucokinase
MLNRIALGADIGGSHITAGLVDLNEKALIQGTIIRQRVQSNNSANDIIKSWAEVIQDVIDLSPNSIGRIGLAVPGPFDYENGVSLIKGQSKYDTLYKLSVKKLLAERLAINPQDIFFKNDAACFLKGELFGGCLENYSKGIGLTIGTGLGTAQQIKGDVQDANLWRKPFKSGIAEDYISTRWFQSRYKELFGTEIEGVKELVQLGPNSFRVAALFEEFAENLAMFMHEFVQLAKPDAIVIGGNISNAHSLFLDKAKGCLYSLIGDEIPVTRSMLGENAALVGAACI